jgi:hypothetical protein
MAILLELRWDVSEGEKLNAAIDYYYDSEGGQYGWLDETEQLTGVPTVVEIGSSDLTITDVRVSTSDREILKRTVPAGKAVQFSYEGMQASTDYRIRVTAQSTDDRTVVRDVVITCSE